MTKLITYTTIFINIYNKMSKIFICSKLCNSENEIETETRKELKIESRTSQKRSSLLNRNMSVLNNQKIKVEDWNHVHIRRDSSNSSQLGIKKGVKSGKDKFQNENIKVNKMEKLLSGSFVNDESENEIDAKSERRIVIKGKSIKKKIKDDDEKSKYESSKINQFDINEIYHCDTDDRNDNKYMLITKKIKTTRTRTVKGKKEFKNKESDNENDDENRKLKPNNENTVKVNHNITKIESISRQSEVNDNDYHYDNTNDNDNVKEERMKKQNENLNISVHCNQVKNDGNLINDKDGKVNIKKNKKEKIKKNDEEEKKIDIYKNNIVNKENDKETNEKDEEKKKRKKMFQSGNYSEVDIFSMSNAYNKLSKSK